MANVAKSDDIGRIENPVSVVLDELVMVDMKQVPILDSVSDKSAIDAGVFVTRHDCTPKLGVKFVAFAAKRFAVLARVVNEIEVSREKVGIKFGNVVPMFRAGFALFADRFNGVFPKSLIPYRHVAKLGFAAVGMMPALVFGYSQSTTTFAIDGEGAEFFAATALASHGDTGRLCFGNGHEGSLYRVSMLPQAGKLENGENCWNPLRANAATAWPVTASANAKNAKDWAISSGATEESVDRSTTRAWSPERTVKPHEYATGNRRYSLVYGESHRSAWLNSSTITKRPYSGKLEALAKFQVRKPVMQALRNDAVKVYDKAAYAQFYLTKLRASPLNGTGSTITLSTTGTASGTNTVALGVNHVKSIVDTMKERNIPPYVGDDYMSIAWPSTLRTFKNTLETLHQYTAAGIQLIFNAEIGRYENVRFTEQTNVSHGITSTGSSGTAWAAGLSDWAFFFGEDTVVEGIAIPEEIRAKIPTDYGRSKGVAYYSINGFGLVHNQTDATESRVVMWDSLG